MSELEFDYIIAGGGVGGCILANRLSADPVVRILLLEAGGRDNSLFIRAPGGLLPIMTRQPRALPAARQGSGRRFVDQWHGL
jgi:choline dehydrogenase